MEHDAHMKSIKGQGVRVYRKSVPTADTEVPPPVPKRTTSIARSRAIANSLSAGPAKAHVAAALPTRDHTAVVLPARDYTANILPARDRTANVYPARDSTANVYPARDRTANVYPARDSTANVYPARDRTVNVYPTRDRTANVYPTRDHTANVYPTRDRTANVYPTRDRTANVYPARDSTANVYPARDRTANVYPTRDSTANVYPARDRTANVYPARDRTANVYPTRDRTANVYPTRDRTANVYPTIDHTDTTIPARTRTAANLLAARRSAAALAVAGRPAAALPVARRPPAALPVVGRPPAPLPVVGRPPAPLPVVRRPPAPLPVEVNTTAAVPSNDNEVSIVPQPRPGITGFMTSMLCKTTAHITNGIERSFRSLMSRRHHDSYRPAAVTGAFLRRAGLTGIAAIDMPDVDMAGVRMADINLSGVDISDADTADMDDTLPTKGYGMSMIMNGSVCPSGQYGDAPYFVKNSCPFDSVIVAVASAYKDYRPYAAFVDTTDNVFLMLAKELGTNGPSKIVYDKRVELLLPFFKVVADVYYCTPPTLRTLDVECNVWKIVQDYLKREPSSIQVKTCSNEEGCPGGLERIQYSASVVLDDCEQMRAKGIAWLRQLMDAYNSTHTAACGKYGCDGTAESKRILGRHLFVETDSLSTDSTEFKCSLGDVPPDLSLAGYKFVLQSVIHFTSFHYVTYVRRPSGQWEIHNDLYSDIRVVRESENEIVCPHAVIYIRL